MMNQKGKKRLGVVRKRVAAASCPLGVFFPRCEGARWCDGVRVDGWVGR